MERRFLATTASPIRLTTRADGVSMLTGYGAVFYQEGDPGTEFKMMSWADEEVVERIMPGAFDRALREDDVRGLFNHDPNFLLGRTLAQTMRLSVDKRGLRYEIDIPETTVGRDVMVSVERGDLTGSSFAFTTDEQVWRDVRQEGGKLLTIREVVAVHLFDTGPVTYPAYQGTTAGVRGLPGEGIDSPELVADRHRRDVARGQARTYLARVQAQAWARAAEVEAST